VKYDQIGKTYNSTRMPDDRITGKLIAHLDLPLGSTIVDVGAGTGNYSYSLAERGYRVIAVEPSATMRRQGKQHERLTWLDGVAEALPVDSRTADGVVCTLASHHFTDLAQSFREMSRVVKPGGSIVVFTADPRNCMADCWIADYFRAIVEDSCRTQPEVSVFAEQFRTATGRQPAVHAFPLPHDLKDRFFFSGWRTPDQYLDERFRSGISSLAAAPPELVAQNVARLSADLSSGDWQAMYGDTLTRTEYDCGYFFLVG